MNKRLQLAALFMTFAVLAGGFGLAHAQAGNVGSICVITYQDANRNGVRDPGEDMLVDINVNLMVASNILVANHVAERKEPYCFENLPAQQYTLSFDSPLYLPVDPDPVSFVLLPGARLTHEFGAVPKPPDESAAPSDTILNIPLTVPVRIGLSLFGALIAMAVFSGLGLVLYGVLLHRRPKPEELAALSGWVPSRDHRPVDLAEIKPGTRDDAKTRLKNVKQAEANQPPAARSERYGDVLDEDEDL